MGKREKLLEEDMAHIRGLINIFLVSLLSIVGWTFAHSEQLFNVAAEETPLLSIEAKIAIIVVGIEFCVIAILILLILRARVVKEYLK